GRYTAACHAGRAKHYGFHGSFLLVLFVRGAGPLLIGPVMSICRLVRVPSQCGFRASAGPSPTPSPHHWSHESARTKSCRDVSSRNVTVSLPAATELNQLPGIRLPRGHRRAIARSRLCRRENGGAVSEGHPERRAETKV